MSAPSLAGKVYAVTGGASGMGLATVKRLVQARARAVCIGDFNDSNFSQVQEALDALNKEGSTTIVLAKLDVSKSAAVNAWIDGIIAQFNALDGCLNAAGIPQMVGARGEPAILEETDESWDTVMGVNLHGVFYCMRAEIAAMVKLEKKPRSIVNIASMASLRYSTDIFAYCVSKWGAAVLSTAVAKDVESANTDIRVNAVSPGIWPEPLNFFKH